MLIIYNNFLNESLLLQITMGLLDLGSLALLFSEVMIRACQMAAVLQMIISQIPHLLGLNIRTKGGIMAAVYVSISFSIEFMR